MAAKKTFVNLPVKNLDKSKEFFAKLWFDGHAFQDADGHVSVQTAAIATLTNVHCDPALLSAASKRDFRELSIPEHSNRHT